MRCAAGAWLSWPWRLELQHHAAWRGPRAGASLAPAVSRPRCSRIARTPPASFTYASTRRLPPHLTQANTSKSNVLLSNSAKVYSRRLLLHRLRAGRCLGRHARLLRSGLGDQKWPQLRAWSKDAVGATRQSWSERMGDAMTL
jgi:hypothetical protein